jgi:hypothetical protein
MVPFWDQYIERLFLGVSSSSSSAAAAAYILIPRSASGHKEFEVLHTATAEKLRPDATTTLPWLFVYPDHPVLMVISSCCFS